MFHSTSYRPLLHPPLPEREIDPALFVQEDSDSVPALKQPPTSWKGPRTGLQLPTIAAVRKQADQHSRATKSDVNAYLSSRVLTIQDIKLPTELVLPLGTWLERWNECMWILRPLLNGISFTLLSFWLILCGAICSDGA